MSDVGTPRSVIVMDWNPQRKLNVPLPQRDLQDYLPALQAAGVDVMALQGVTNAIGARAGREFDFKNTAERSLVVNDSFYTPFWEAEQMYIRGEETLHFHDTIQYGDQLIVLNPDYQTIVREARFYEGRYDAYKGATPQIVEQVEQPRAVQRMVMEIGDGDKRLQVVNTLGPSVPRLSSMREQTHTVIEMIDPKLPTVVTGDFCGRNGAPDYQDLVRRGHLRSPLTIIQRAAELGGDALLDGLDVRCDLLFGSDWVVPIAFATLGPHPRRYDFGSRYESRLMAMELTALPHCPSESAPALLEIVIS